MINIDEIFKIYNIPDNVSILDDFQNLKSNDELVIVSLIENNKIICTWDITETIGKDASALISMIRAKSIPNATPPVKKIIVTKTYYKIMYEKFQLIHNENGYAIEKYINHELDEKNSSYYIDGIEIDKELVVKNPEVLKDPSLRKILS